MGVLSSIIDWSLHNRVVVLVATLILVVLGLRAAQNLPIDAVPDGADTAPRFHVDVAGTLRDTVPNDEVGELDHRGGGRVAVRNGLRAHFLDQLDGVVRKDLHG